MKKIILAAFIAFSIVSCSDGNESTENIVTKDSHKVKVTFGDSFLKTSKTSANTKKDVNRPSSIPTGIDLITVTTKNISLGTAPVNTAFNIIPTGGVTDFILDGVMTGTNDFTATATTTSNPSNKVELIASASAKNQFNTYTGDIQNNYAGAPIPYATYAAAVTGLKIDFASSPEIYFDMKTSNGRLNTLVQTGPSVTTSNLYVKITRTVYNKSKNTTVATDYNISGDSSLVSTWNDEDAIYGSTVNLLITVYNGTDDTAPVIYSQTCDLQIKGSTITNTQITVNKEKMTISTNTGAFQFPTWRNEDNIN
jgi:hypothetical protein